MTASTACRRSRKQLVGKSQTGVTIMYPSTTNKPRLVCQTKDIGFRIGARRNLLTALAILHENFVPADYPVK